MAEVERDRSIWAWSVTAPPDRRPVLPFIAPTRRQVLDMVGRYHGRPWRADYRAGWRCVRVRIAPWGQP